MARSLLGMVVPNILARKTLRGQEAVILEYATADNKDFQVQQFADFFHEKSPKEIVTLISKVFGNVLMPFFKSQKISHKAAKNLYFLPRLHQGEYDKLSSIANQSKYIQDGEFVIQGISQSFPNPGKFFNPDRQKTKLFHHYHSFFLERRPVGLCIAHGDLNPRNLLIDGIGSIFIIDFSEMKKDGARFLDFVRLEAEVKFKLTKLAPSSLESYLILDYMLSKVTSLENLIGIRDLPLDIGAKKMVMAVCEIRRNAYSICAPSLSYDEFLTEYYLGLLAQSLRISLFDDYLSDTQQEFAVISAGSLIRRLEVLFINQNEIKSG